MVKVSIIIPTFNNSNIILDAIKSVIKQNVKDYEIIVIDDGSTDNTSEILAPIINTHSIRYFYQDNRGPGAARNSGIKVANGEYICFLDADDLLLKDSIEKRMSFLEKNKDIAMVCSDFSLNFNSFSNVAILKKSNFLDLLVGSIEKKDENTVILNEMFLIDFFKRNMPVFTGTVMIKKSIVEKIGFFREDTNYSEDRDYWWRIIKYYKRIGYIDEPLSFYRRDEGSLCKNLISLYSGTINFLTNVLNDIRNDTIIMRGSFRNELKKVIKNRLSGDYLELGREYFRKLNIEKSKYCFIKSIKHNLFNLKTYVFLVLTYFPAFLLRKIRAMKQ